MRIPIHSRRADSTPAKTVLRYRPVAELLKRWLQPIKYLQSLSAVHRIIIAAVVVKESLIQSSFAAIATVAAEAECLVSVVFDLNFQAHAASPCYFE
jgi:hypothetical protein